VPPISWRESAEARVPVKQNELSDAKARSEGGTKDKSARTRDVDHCMEKNGDGKGRSALAPEMTNN